MVAGPKDPKLQRILVTVLTSKLLGHRQWNPPAVLLTGESPLSL